MVGARAKVKVLHVHTRMIRGGGDENTLFVVNGVDPERYQVDLAVGSESEEEMLARVSPRVRVIMVPEMVRRISPRRDLVAGARLVRLIRSERYDIVHTHMAKGGMLGRFAARVAGAPVVIHTLDGQTFHPHLDPVRFAFFREMERVTARITDRFIVVGEELRDWYLGAGVGYPEQYEVIYSGMDLGVFWEARAGREGFESRVRASLGVEEGAPLVGKVARHTEGKGYEYFLDVAERVLDVRPEARFVALGSGERLEGFRQEIRSRGLEGKVIAAGFRSDIAEVMACLDVLVHTSLWEGLCRVLVQGAAVGLPIVTFEVGGAREVVLDGESGYVVPSKDVATMTWRVLSLLGAPEVARRMGEAGRKHVGDRWSIERSVSRVEQEYERALAKQAQERGRRSCGPI